MRYIHDSENWWQFHYDSQQIMNVLGRVRAKQGYLIGRMMSLGFDSQDEAMLSNLSLELVRSSEIEGKELNLEEVRSSIARRLGIDTAGLVPVSHYVDGVVEMYAEYFNAKAIEYTQLGANVYFMGPGPVDDSKIDSTTRKVNNADIKRAKRYASQFADNQVKDATLNYIQNNTK